MLATIKKNKMGHIHIWFRNVNVVQVDKYNFHGNEQESDLYLQNQSEIRSFLDDIDSEDAEKILDGYTIKTFIADEYKDM